jgi:hypothetical protein
MTGFLAAITCSSWVSVLKFLRQPANDVRQVLLLQTRLPSSNNERKRDTYREREKENKEKESEMRKNKRKKGWRKCVIHGITGV